MPGAMRIRGGSLLALVVIGAVGLAALPAAGAGDPDVLWKIVHGQCAPHQATSLDPAPCAFVAEGAPHGLGYAVLKDRDGASQYLLIPTDRVTGIEDPKVLKPGSETYLERAWAFRSLMFARLGRTLPDADVSLAINSQYGRSQNQLHIHIDCVRADVQGALKRQQASIGPAWTPLAEPLAGHAYLAMGMPAKDLARTNLFRRLARTVPAGGMGRQTLVVVGAVLASGEPGFDVLVDRADLPKGDHASGEELQDHDCAVKSDQP